MLAWCREQGLPAFDRRTHTGLLRNLIVREGRRTGQLQVRLVTGPGEIDGPSLAAAVDCDGLSWTTTDALAETTQGGETLKLAGNRTLEEELCGLSFSIAPNAFFQTNTEMAEQLYGIAGELADLKGWERVYDLYCGIGTVGLSLAARAGEVWGLEIVEQAVANAITNAKRNGIRNAKFFAGDVRLALRELVEEASRPDVCIIDPPRAGLSQKVVRRIIEAAPRRIVYISCNPTSLAPNAAQLVEAGWTLKRVVPVDMFPQTPHIECVARARTRGLRLWRDPAGSALVDRGQRRDVADVGAAGRWPRFIAMRSSSPAMASAIPSRSMTSARARRSAIGRRAGYVAQDVQLAMTGRERWHDRRASRAARSSERERRECRGGVHRARPARRVSRRRFSSSGAGMTSRSFVVRRWP